MLGFEEAFSRLRARALAQGRTLSELAGEVIARRLRLIPSAPHEEPSDPTPPVARLGDPSSVMTGVEDFDGYTASINPTYQAVLGWSVHSCDNANSAGFLW